MFMEWRPSSSVHIWFLDTDLTKSAEYLPNYHLFKSITGCIQMLINARFYFIGIRNKTAYNYYFAKARKQETYDRFFPNWPYPKPPKFSFYASKTTKWARQCNEHYQYLVSYLEILLLEYSCRFKKTHTGQKFYDWLTSDAPDLNIPNANIREVTIPWKALKKKYRNKDIILGYRNQMMGTFENDDPYKAYANNGRDIPDFVVKHFHLDIADMMA